MQKERKSQKKRRNLSEKEMKENRNWPYYRKLRLLSCRKAAESKIWLPKTVAKEEEDSISCRRNILGKSKKMK